MRIKDKFHEDEIYLYDQELQDRVRRGNTLIKISQNSIGAILGNFEARRGPEREFDGSGYVVGRRGLPKFFILRPIHLKALKAAVESSERLYGVFGQKGCPRLAYYEWRTMFPRVLSILEATNTQNSSKTQKNPNAGSSVCIYLTEKADGSNAQVSYVDLLTDPDLEKYRQKNTINPEYSQFWVVSSKNVSIIFRDARDLSPDSSDPFRALNTPGHIKTAEKTNRTKYAKNIAKVWLGTLKTLKPDTVEDLKRFLTSHTLVGEWRGSKIHQQCVQYPKEEIVFYSVVEKRSPAICLPFRHGYNIVSKKYGLSFVQFKEIGKIIEKKNFFKKISKISQKVASKSVLEGGEGCVLYFESHCEGDDSRSVLGMAKVKTMEYKFWFKLRQKLNTFLRAKKAKSASEVLAEFAVEISGMVGEGNYTPFREIGFYNKVAEKCVKVLKKHPRVGMEVLERVYLDFLYLVIKCFGENDRMPTSAEIGFFERFDAEEYQTGASRVTGCSYEFIKSV